jgi:Zn-finger nucleic acid-binding protein
MSVATLRCPACGAAAGPDAAACAYCGGALAAVACPSCFAAMAVGSGFCPSCGVAGARAALDDHPAIACPVCPGAELRAALLGDTRLHECGGCSAVWMHAAAFERLCASREQRASALALLAPPLPGAAAGGPVRYVPCPECRKLMHRVNFARASGVIVDVCQGHGVWLDRGELQRVVAFIDRGGVEQARARERERLREDERRVRERERSVQIRATVTGRMSAPYHRGPDADPAVVDADTVIDFLRAALDL